MVPKFKSPLLKWTTQPIVVLLDEFGICARGHELHPPKNIQQSILRFIPAPLWHTSRIRKHIGSNQRYPKGRTLQIFDVGLASVELNVLEWSNNHLKSEFEQE